MAHLAYMAAEQADLDEQLGSADALKTKSVPTGLLGRLAEAGGLLPLSLNRINGVAAPPRPQCLLLLQALLHRHWLLQSLSDRLLLLLMLR